VEPVNDRDAIENAIQGMLSSLDPHSSYLNQRSFRDMQTQTRGEFGGLGIEVTQEGGYIKVISPIDETPAARAGIRPGDFITHLNGTSVQGLTLQEAVEQMRGQRNTQIKITIRRQGTERPIELTLTRDVIRPQVVRFRLEDGNLGYVRMREERTDEFQDMRHIGTTTAGELKRVRTWVIEEYAAQNETHPFTFDMWQIYNASTNERIRKSRMCHDFLEDVLGRLQFSDTSDVMAVDSKVSVFRDSLNLNITQWTNVDMSNNKIRRDYQRFLRFFQNHIYEATRDMSFSRVTVTKIITLGLPFILFLDGNKYVKLSPSMHGVFNYCRMPMDFVKDQPYVPAKLDDERKQCFLPHYNYFEFKENIRFTFADYLIWAEQKLDDAIFGVDGNGVDLWTHLALVTETLVVLIAVTRLIKWTAGKISRV
jgi:hypothetical protein